MAEQPTYGQPYQQPYPYQQPPAQPPYPQAPPQQQGYQGAPQQPYQNPYAQQPPQQQPYPPQQYGTPQQYPPQQYPGPGQQFPNQQSGPGQAQAGKKPKKKRSRWAIFFIVLFSPFIAVIFALYGIYWVLCWLLTPVAMVLHFVFCGIGLIWYTPVKFLASGRSKFRLFQPLYPKFPPFWTGAYWVLLNRRVRSTFEALGGLAELLNW